MTDDVLARRATSFGVGADDYVRGRPGYPADAIAWCLPDGARRVLDLGAGTGAIGRVLLNVSVEVVSVEPLEEMRRHIPITARPLGGVAEAIPFAAGSFDAVFVGQAFHWFRRDEAVAEIVRVLRPGGTVGLLWNLLDDRVDWVGSVAALFNAEDRIRLLMASEAPHPFGDNHDLTGIEELRIEHLQPSDVDSLRANVASRSTVLLMPPQQRDRVLQRVAELAPGQHFEVPYVCQAWRAVRR